MPEPSEREHLEGLTREQERTAANLRLRDTIKTEIAALLWAISELDFVGWRHARLTLTNDGPVIRLTGDYAGVSLARLIELAGQNFEVELEDGALVYSCPSWPDVIPF